jgi:lipopolysaccharide transport system permease protein
VVLRPRTTWAVVDWGELWRYRDLLKLLAWRDLQVRYRQTVLGVLWAVLQPVLTMVVLSAVFGQLVGLARTTGDVPYPVFLYAGLLPWMLLAALISAAGQSLVSQANLLGKVYFPRLLLPLAAGGAPLVDWALASVVLAALMAWYGVGLSWQLLLLPALLATLLAAGLGIGIGLSALTVRFRDFRYVVPFALQVWFFVTPVILPESALPARLAWLRYANPVAGTISGFRAAVLGRPIDYPAWGSSAVLSLAALALGLMYFQRTERQFADVV